MAVNIAKIKACPECGSTNIFFNKKSEEIVCRDCGGIFSKLTPDQEKKFEKASDVI